MSNQKIFMRILRLLVAVPPLVAFTILIINLFQLDIVPTKYLTVIIILMLVIIAGLVALVTRRHLAPRIVSYVLGLVLTIAAAVVSYYLIHTNNAIADFAAKSVVITDQTGTADITNTPFVLLVNGLDAGAGQRTDGVSNSDVNQMVVVNPVMHQILLVNTPRDYYVYLHGVTEKRDKLTHAGYYGPEMSRQTLEDLYNIDIDYYVRINFETLVKLVDVIGGIDIDSDSSFTTSSGTHINKGRNHLNGKEALAFARERKHFGTGDIQRAADQQIVMIAIFDKITKSDALLGNFTEILASLQDSFTTDLSIADVKKLVKTQLDEAPHWDIETTAVTGKPLMTSEVYSLKPTQKYYVVVPDESSIAATREKILTVLERSDENL